MKRKFIFVLCFCLMLGMAPMAAYALPGDGGNELDHMYTDKDLTYKEDAVVFIYATPGACDIVDEGGSSTHQNYRISNFEGWYFEGWKTWYTGREIYWFIPSTKEVNKANPKYDDGNTWYFSKHRISQEAYTSNTYDYMKERIQVNKEGGYRGTYYLYAIFRPVLTVNAGDGISYSVSGAYQVPVYGGAALEGKYAVLYNGSASVTYKVDPAYEITGISASYGTSYSVSGQTITVSGMQRPGSISINTEKKHVHDYSGTWSSDGSSHWRECSCGEKTDAGTHSGGTATCVDAAVCAVCGKAYGTADKQNHASGTEIRGAVQAGEFTEGYSGDVYCKGCGEMLSEGKVIPASHQHSYSTDWSSDGSSHWHECTCGERSGMTGHTGGNATCVKAAECSECGHTYGKVDPANHTGATEVRGYVAAGEFTEGYTGDTYCGDCKTLLEKGKVIPASHQHSYNAEWSYDRSSHWHECSCGVKKDAASHSFSEATCTEPMKCSECGFTSGEAKGHDYTEANCQAPATCTDCGDTYGEPDKSRHTGEMEITGAVEAEEFRDGYTGDIYCKECNALVKKGEVIPKTHEEEPSDKQESDKGSPKTGDDFGMIYWFALAVAAVAVVVAYAGRRRTDGHR